MAVLSVFYLFLQQEAAEAVKYKKGQHFVNKVESHVNLPVEDSQKPLLHCLNHCCYFQSKKLLRTLDSVDPRTDIAKFRCCRNIARSHHSRDLLTDRNKILTFHHT